MTGGRPETMVVMAEYAYRQLFGPAEVARLASLGRLDCPQWTPLLPVPRLSEVEVLITGWGCPPLDATVLAGAPRLCAVFHAAGTVRQHITAACWERGLLITAAADANAIPVAEYTLAAILWTGKRVPWFAASAQHLRRPISIDEAPPAVSNLGRTIGLVGFSRVGRRVLELLRPFDFTVLVADPYADPVGVAELGGALVELDAMLPRCDILSLHAPELPETRRLLDGARLARLPDGATVINTARGSLVDTGALTAQCATGRLHAILDVTEPDPLPPASALYSLPNVVLTPHIAGSLNEETRRMTAMALDELDRYARGDPPLRPVLAEQLSTMA